MLGSGSSSNGGSENPAILELLLNISSELGEVSSPVQPGLSENKASISDISLVTDLCAVIYFSSQCTNLLLSVASYYFLLQESHC